MRTKRLASAAVLAASMAFFAGCNPENINTNTNINNFPRQGTTVASDTVRNATCLRTYSLVVVAPGTSLMNMQRDERREIYVRGDSLGSNCPTPYDFDFTSTNPHNISVTRISPNTGQVAAHGPGHTATICAEALPDRVFKICAPASVVGVSSTVTITPIANILTGANCPRTAQGVVSPAGTPGVWSVSGVTGVTVSSTGAIGGIQQGATGQLTLTFDPTNGEPVSITINLVNQDCGSNACAVVSFVPTAPDLSLNIGQQVQISPNIVSNPAGCATVSYASLAPSVITVNSTGLVTGASAGVGSVRVTPSVGQPVDISFNVSASNIVANPASITLSNCAGFQTSWPITLTANGTTTTGTLASSNTGVATVSGQTVTITGTVGTSTVTATTSSGSVPIQVTVTQCPPVSPITVDVTPATFSLVVGQAPLTFTCTVSNVPTGQPTGCTWEAVFVGTTQSAANCLTLTPQGNGNTAIGTPIAGCTQQIEVRGRAAANASVFDTSLGNVSSGTVTCTITWNGTTTGTITVGVGQNTSVTGSCTNQFGASFTPYWYIGAPPTGAGPHIATVVGTNAQVTIAGVTYPAGTQASIRGNSAGQATVFMQAAITDMTVLAQRLVTVQ